MIVCGCCGEEAEVVTITEEVDNEYWGSSRNTAYKVDVTVCCECEDFEEVEDEDDR